MLLPTICARHNEVKCARGQAPVTNFAYVFFISAIENTATATTGTEGASRYGDIKCC